MKRSILLLGLALSTSFLAGAAVPPPEKLVPRETVVLITVPDAAKSRELGSKSSMSQLWNSPVMKEFHDRFSGKLQENIIKPIEKQLGISFKDYSNLAQGQITFALTLEGTDSANPTPGFLFLIDARDQKSQLSERVASLKKKWTDAGKQVKPEKIRDVEFSSITVTPEEIKKALEKILPDTSGFEQLNGNPRRRNNNDGNQGGPVTFLIGQSDSLLILGSAAKQIEQVLAHQTGGSAPSVSDKDNFASVANTMFRDAQTYGWVDVKTFVAIIQKAMAENPQFQTPNLPPVSQIFAGLGFNGLKSLSFSTRVDSAGTHMDLFASAPEAERKGLLKMFSFEKQDAAPPAFVPGDVASFVRGRIDMKKTWEALESTLSQTVPAAAGLMKLALENLGKDKDPNFDFRRDFVSNLGNDLISYSRAPKGGSFIEMSQQSGGIYLLGSPDPKKLASAIKTIVPAQAGEFKEREFLGNKIYELSLPSFGPQQSRGIILAAGKNYLAIGTDSAGVEEYLRDSTKGKTLKDSADLAQASQAVGGFGTGYFAYNNSQTLLRPYWDAFRKEGNGLVDMISNAGLGPLLADNPNLLKEWLDFSLLPAYDKVSKYFYISVSSASVTPDGFALKSFAPTPPGLK